MWKKSDLGKCATKPTTGTKTQLEVLNLNHRRHFTGCAKVRTGGTTESTGGAKILTIGAIIGFRGAKTSLGGTKTSPKGAKIGFGGAKIDPIGAKTGSGGAKIEKQDVTFSFLVSILGNGVCF
jgi:hypothetical protein